MTFLRTWLFALLASTLMVGLTGCGSDDSEPVTTSIFTPTEFGEYEFDASPNIQALSRINFGDVAEGVTAYRVIEVINDGREDLIIQGWEVPEGFVLELPEDVESDVIPPGESLRVTIAYEAITEREVEAELIIDSNDPDTPKWPVQLLVNVRYPCLEITPQRVDFGAIEPEVSAERRVRMLNCSPNADTTFSIAGIDGPGVFEVDDEWQDVVLLPGESTEVDVRFVPGRSGSFEGVMRVVSDDFENPEQEVILEGVGTAEPCPVPVIRARATNRTSATANPVGTFNGLPLDSVILDAQDSFHPEGRIAEFQWTLVSRPTDSSSDLLGPEGDLTRRLWMDLAGEYIVDLDVVGDDGVSACRSARMRLVATANEDIHIQLVWQTPNDPDQLDSSGSDVDLHLLHPIGDWNIRPYDCFWQNMEPDWGEARRLDMNGDRVGYDDDPSLDIDDTDGRGPENINLDNPEALTYGVGVHYFADHGYNISFATVRIFIGGELFAEFLDQRLADAEFWHVADIEWPGGVINRIDLTYPSFPQRTAP